MKTVTVKKLVIGEGMPKIIVSLMGNDVDCVRAEAQAYRDAPFDILEWRADHFTDVLSKNAVLDALRAIRDALPETPLLCTFRSAQEGGEQAIPREAYLALNQSFVDSDYVDMIDVELFTGDAEVENLVTYAHQKNVRVVMSNHDFASTPAEEEIIQRLCRMQALGADIPKIAVMPQNKRDLLTLLSATLEMHERYADRPIITMSMAKEGVISRLAGEVFGSAATFGAVKKVSAPGQISVQNLRTVLTVLHHA